MVEVLARDTQHLKHFGDCFAGVLMDGGFAEEFHSSGQDLRQLAADWADASVRMLVSGVDGDTEIRQACAAAGLSPSFVDAVLSGYDGASERCAALSADTALAHDPRLTRRVADVAAAVLLGGKPILCPFTGERALARDSIDLHTFLHRCGRRACIVLPDWRISQYASDRAWFFPDGNLLLVSIPHFDARAPLVQTAARVMANHGRVTAYLADPRRLLMVSEDSMSHIGHHIWNVIPGWAMLFSLAPPERIDIITSYRTWQIFGGVTELYPDQAARAGSVVRPESQDEVYELMLERRATSLVLVDGYTTAEAAARVVGWSRRHCESAFLAEVAALRKAAFPLLMVTIRTENRAWVGQEDGLACLINELARDYPRLGVIFDGLNGGMEQLASHALMSLADEQAIAMAIMAACPNVRFHNALGCLPHESIILAEAIDAFLAPVGAGLAKTRWIANKPGVAFSNQSFLRPGSNDGFLYDRFRDGLVPMRYVDQAEVQDVEDARHGEKSRANFVMSWRAPLRELTALLRTL